MTAESSDKDMWKTFMVDYEFDGKLWTFDLIARSREEAEYRLATIKEFAWIEGELSAEVDVKGSPGLGMPKPHAN